MWLLLLLELGSRIFPSYCDMVAVRGDPDPIPRHHGAHHKPAMAIKRQKYNEPSQNWECQESEQPCMTCNIGGTLDNYEECTCYFEKFRTGNSCECHEICGVLKDLCSECRHAYDEVSCECTCSLCQQSVCMDCENCKECSGTWGQYDRQNEKEHDAFYQKGNSGNLGECCEIGKLLPRSLPHLRRSPL